MFEEQPQLHRVCYIAHLCSQEISRPFIPAGSTPSQMQLHPAQELVGAIIRTLLVSNVRNLTFMIEPFTPPTYTCIPFFATMH